MKTLDEVIDKLIECHTRWCRWSETSDIVDRSAVEDALFYLKEYKANQEDPDGDHQQLEKAQKLLWEFYQNDPLTWNELKQMEGKPVWIDSVPLVRRWVIIKKFHPIGGNNNLFDMEVEDGAHFLRKSMGRDTGAWWQAYRKELE